MSLIQSTRSLPLPPHHYSNWTIQKTWNFTDTCHNPPWPAHSDWTTCTRTRWAPRWIGSRSKCNIVLIGYTWRKTWNRFVVEFIPTIIANVHLAHGAKLIHSSTNSWEFFTWRFVNAYLSSVQIRVELKQYLTSSVVYPIQTSILVDWDHVQNLIGNKSNNVSTIPF